ncbi:HAE1 family hydrophobic/amphiphilic exporter-1 [Hydrogenispora ethanolica]|uniref:HAE1 family hydrophobic/amphiphilic exporter-1 n=1 Tax=Hydrogenispora ethanolica TaxID=1082276 RepID=A0A4R1RDX2_HYDET|nr:efflux RND transporter permease subunit [Hydrogenispora ethanolica]TCL63752.1 HAE1 family hydrophobic/amphiphilic exporter-1 [Hydrogenispora ethanolica]
MQKLIELCVRRPVGVLIFVLFAVTIGAVSLSLVKMDLYPDIDFPAIMVMTTYEGVGPEEIENSITRPLEEAISAVPNVKKVTSTSSQGNSVITAECNYGTDMDFTNLKMRERIDLVKRYLPEDAEDPLIFKMDPAMIPIVFWGMSSPKGLAEATRLAEDKIKPRLERVPGVASVSLSGGLTREIQILLSANKLAFYKIDPTYVKQAIAQENLNLPGGVVREGRNELTVRTLGEFKTVAELQNIKLTLPSGAQVPLQELAEVKDAYHERKQLSRINGDESLMIILMKESDANTVLVTREVRKALSELQGQLGKQVSIHKVFEQAEFIESSLKNVAQNAIMGGLLAVIILFFFLRSFRSTLVISAAIPISIIITFAMIYFSKLTLNLVSMGGLALGVGMLVDNAIVVLESIHRYREEGHNALESAIKGTSEVGLAITASTLTTIIVFAPVLFVEDISAQIFREMAYVVSFSLTASLVVALTVIPTLSAKVMNFIRTPKAASAKLAEEGELRLGKVEWIYRTMLHWAVQHRGKTVLLALLCFILGIVPFFLGIKTEFMPSIGQKEFSVEFELPLGTNLTVTDGMARKIETSLRKMADVEMVYSIIGSSGFGFGGSSEESEKGTVYVTMRKDTKTPMEELLDQARQRVKGLPGVKLKVQESDNGPSGGGAPLVVNIEGPELAVLERLSESIRQIVAKIPGTRDVDTNWQTGRPELRITINRERANAYGLSAAAIGNAIQTAFSGSVASQIRLAGEEYDIFLQFQPHDRQVLADLEKLHLRSGTGAAVPLKEVVNLIPAKGPTQITRENQTRQVQVSAKFVGRDLGKMANLIEQRIRSEVIFPNNYSFSMGGQVKDMQDSNSALLIAFVLAVLFVYMVIAVQYENLIHPLAIMGTLPLSLFGVSWSLFLTGQSLNVTSMIGVIMLAGIVVNNAIVLVDYIETLRSRGLSRREAILKAGPTRLRPVLMTALTTILGLVPLAVGQGDGGMLNASLAVVVIGGLSFCTLLTLVAIPVIYSLLDDLAAWTRRAVFRRTGAAEYHR